MLGHFTSAARTAIALAQEEARGLGHRQVGVEHLLLGLLREETGLGGRLLEELGLTVDGARAEVARLSPRGKGRMPDQLEFTPGAKTALEHALRNALEHEQQVIGPEHILLGALDAGNKVALGVLRACGGDPDTLRESLLEWLRSEPPEGAPGTERSLVRLAPSGPRWEYRLHAFDSVDGEAAEELNRLGAEGWELVATVGDAPWFVFKRRQG